MDDFTRINLHCHSIFSSDGELTPEAVVVILAEAGVRYAALTDHDSVEGLSRFADAARRHDIATLTGVELTTYHAGRSLHLLGYGFDPEHLELRATLLALRQARELDVHSIAGSMRKLGAPVSSVPHVAVNGTLSTAAAIGLIHRAGGCAFFAHPLHFESNLDLLAAQIDALAAQGLDGIEAFYAPFTPDEQARIYALATTRGLLACAGTDLHTRHSSPVTVHAVEMPTVAWRALRRALMAEPAAPAPSGGGAPGEGGVPSREPAGGTPIRLPTFRLRFFVGRILLPTLLAIILFVVAIWGVILPAFEASLMDRQREMIRELTNSAWSILASYQQDEADGLLTQAEAQHAAIARIAALRYGREGKDYFWLQDMQPRIIMHPYRTDLNGQDVSTFTDARGVQIFVAFADLVRRQDEGYVDYVWQWKDDPERLAPKESYIRGFAPWGWIIGTGIYIDDIHAEITRLEQRMVNVALAISAVMVGLMLFVVQQSLSIERRRRDVEDSLRESTERYHALAEATTEGALLVVDGRCRYANPTFLHMAGYTASQLDLLELVELLPRGDENALVWSYVEQQGREATGPGGFEGLLQRADGGQIECVFAVNPITFAGQAGLILLAKDITPRPASREGETLAHAVEGAGVAVFRARATRRGAFVEQNAACQALLAGLPLARPDQPALADLFADTAEYQAYLQRLLTDGEIHASDLHLVTVSGAARFVGLTARLTRDEEGHPAFVEGVLTDVTAMRNRDAEAMAQIARLQSSLIFLHEPVGSLGADAVFCRLDTPVAQAAAQMTAAQATAALVVSEVGTPIGIVTDNDMRARVLAGGVAPETLMQTIMSAPLVRISAQALIYEALMRMEEKGVKHLAVEDESGRVVGVIDNQALIQFQRYGSIVLTREISRGQDAAAVAQSCRRAPFLVRALVESGVRPRNITHMLAAVCDAATERLIALAMEELGPPPVPFVWVGMGSQGRQEQTLLTDQDNGIVYADAAVADTEQTAAYFLQLGERVCAGLQEAGYPFCRGNVMASHPRWCRSLSGWKEGFATWVRKAEPQEIMELSIFFDFRPVVGDAELAHELRRYIQVVLADQPAFYPLMAQNALAFKPPIRLLGSVYVRGGATDQVGQINLKDAMMPLVSFARLYALRHHIHQTHTLARLEALTEAGYLQPSTRDELAAAYDFLMQLRLRQQIAAAALGRPLDNLVATAKLSRIEHESLKEAFAQIAAVQKKVAYDFLGGV